MSSAQTFAKIERALNPRMREFLSTLPQVLSAKAGPRSAGPSERAWSTSRAGSSTPRAIAASSRCATSRPRATARRSYTVEPYRLTLAQGGVYLVGWVPQYEEFRTFAAERIEKLSVSARHVQEDARAAGGSVRFVARRVLGRTGARRGGVRRAARAVRARPRLARLAESSRTSPMDASG